IVTTFQADSEGISTDDVITQLLKDVRMPLDKLSKKAGV
ncbi:MAG TPA: AAA family ATPase, partial [Planctomycetaceae bacterium]|nr:AAA family ATPase [Planctomycetaceae bacterium]